jgi:hypothetical protein
MMAAGLLTARNARAQAPIETSLVPSVSFGSTYDDNLFARTTSDAGVMTIMRPAIEANYESPRTSASSLFSFDLQHSNFPALSTLDARRHGNVDIKRRATTALTLAFGVRYDRTETPGELNLDSGILGERRVADRWEAVPSMTYRTSTLTTIAASYSGMTETLVGDVRSNMHVVRGSLIHEVSPHDEITIGYLGRHFIDAFGTRTSHAVLAGWTRALDYATHFTLQAGPRVSADRGLDAEIVAGLARTTNRSRIGVDYWHGETVILGIPGPVKVDTTAAKLMRSVTPRAEIGVNAGLTNSTTLLNQNVRVLQAVVVGNWTPHGGAYTFSASYGAERQHGILIDGFFFDDQVVRHTLNVSVTIAPRLSRKFRPTGELPVVHAQGDSQ